MMDASPACCSPLDSGFRRNDERSAPNDWGIPLAPLRSAKGGFGSGDLHLRF